MLYTEQIWCGTCRGFKRQALYTRHANPWFCVVHRTRTTPKRPWDFNISSLWFNIMNFIVLTTVVVALPFSLLRPVFYLANLFTRTSKKQMWLAGDVVSVCHQPIMLLHSLFALTNFPSGKPALSSLLLGGSLCTSCQCPQTSLEVGNNHHVQMKSQLKRLLKNALKIYLLGKLWTLATTAQPIRSCTGYQLARWRISIVHTRSYSSSKPGQSSTNRC